MPTEVTVVNVSGDALGWFKLGVIANTAIGVVIILLLTTLLVVQMWRGG